MRIWQILLLTAHAVTTSVEAAGDPVPAGPRIEFGGKVLDFGRLALGESRTNAFTFTNTGNAVLQVRSVSSSCGCATVGEWKHALSPGETGSVAVRLHGGYTTGPLEKTVVFQCTALNESNITLRVKADVWEPVFVHPRQVFFPGLWDTNTRSNQTVLITNKLDVPLELGPPEVAGPAFRAELSVLKPGQEYALQIRTVPPLARGVNEGVITMASTFAELPRVTVKVLAVVLKSVTISPERILLPSGALATSMSRTVVVRGPMGKSFTVEEAKINASGVVLTEASGKAGERRYQLDFPEGFVLPAGETVAFSFRTSEPGFEHCQLPVLSAGSGLLPAKLASGATGAGASGGRVQVMPQPPEMTNSIPQ